jgi:hypothetical protein
VLRCRSSDIWNRDRVYSNPQSTEVRNYGIKFVTVHELQDATAELSMLMERAKQLVATGDVGRSSELQRILQTSAMSGGRGEIFSTLQPVHEHQIVRCLVGWKKPCFPPLETHLASALFVLFSTS